MNDRVEESAIANERAPVFTKNQTRAIQLRVKAWLPGNDLKKPVVKLYVSFMAKIDKAQQERLNSNLWKTILLR